MSFNHFIEYECDVCGRLSKTNRGGVVYKAFRDDNGFRYIVSTYPPEGWYSVKYKARAGHDDYKDICPQCMANAIESLAGEKAVLEGVGVE